MKHVKTILPVGVASPIKPGTGEGINVDGGFSGVEVVVKGVFVGSSNGELTNGVKAGSGLDGFAQRKANAMARMHDPATPQPMPARRILSSVEKSLLGEDMLVPVFYSIHRRNTI
jgi:hypothetical protein